MAHISMSFSRKGGLGPIGPKTSKLLMLVVKKTTFDVVRTEKKLINTGVKSGKFYKKSKTGKLHQASAPGESPATDTGALAASINGKAKGFEGLISASADYAQPLEYGTVHMAARPFKVVALKKNGAAFMQACAQAMKDAAQ